MKGDKMENFKEGDVVQLKSGGPIMTVRWAGNSSTEENVVHCEWFEKTELKNGSFKPGQLDRA